MSPKVIIVGLLGMMVVVAGLVFVVTANQTPDPGQVSYLLEDKSRPVAETGETSFDVGEIKLADVVTRDFNFKNSGDKPLQILNINSSCGCTSGKIIYRDFSSKEFGMHAQSGFVTEVAPGDSATLQLIYRPSSMPVFGAVEREVYLTTNDPGRSKLVFSIRAVVR